MPGPFAICTLERLSPRSKLGTGNEYALLLSTYFSFPVHVIEHIRKTRQQKQHYDRKKSLGPGRYEYWNGIQLRPRPQLQCLLSFFLLFCYFFPGCFHHNICCTLMGKIKPKRSVTKLLSHDFKFISVCSIIAVF